MSGIIFFTNDNNILNSYKNYVYDHNVAVMLATTRKTESKRYIVFVFIRLKKIYPNLQEVFFG